MNLQEEIKSLKAHIALIEKQIADEKKQEENKFERVIGENYYIVDSCRLSGTEITKEYDNNNRYDKSMYENNNYFHTKERAEEVAEKIKMLLELERLYDIYCPDYKPDFNDVDCEKYFVYYDYYKKTWETSGCNFRLNAIEIFFPTEEIAQKVCDILNSERRQNNGK